MTKDFNRLFRENNRQHVEAARKRIFDGLVASREEVLDNIVTVEELKAAGFVEDPVSRTWRRGFV